MLNLKYLQDQLNRAVDKVPTNPANLEPYYKTSLMTWVFHEDAILVTTKKCAISAITKKSKLKPQEIYSQE